MTDSSVPGVFPREEPSHVLLGACPTEALQSTVADDQYKEALGFPDPRSGGKGSSWKATFLVFG